MSELLTLAVRGMEPSRALPGTPSLALPGIAFLPTIISGIIFPSINDLSWALPRSTVGVVPLLPPVGKPDINEVLTLEAKLSYL